MQSSKALACLQVQFQAKLQFMAGNCFLLLSIGAVNSSQLSLVESVTSWILLIGPVVVFCLSFSPLHNTLEGRLVIPWFSLCSRV